MHYHCATRTPMYEVYVRCAQHYDSEISVASSSLKYIIQHNYLTLEVEVGVRMQMLDVHHSLTTTTFFSF